MRPESRLGEVLSSALPEKYATKLVKDAERYNPGWKSRHFERVLRVAEAFTELVLISSQSPYDGFTNQRKIWRLLLNTTLDVELPLWQFVCPPKITLKGDVWQVTRDSKYDILEPSLERTIEIMELLKNYEIPAKLTIFYPDDEVTKARASGLKIEQGNLELANQLADVNLEICIELEEIVSKIPLTSLSMWSEISLEGGMDIDAMFEEELEWWRKDTGSGFFIETKKWLERTFKFSSNLATELTARRLAKYAVEGKIVCKLYPFGSIYLNNEFPYNESWAMYTASVTKEQRRKMAVLYYINKRR